MHQSRFIHLWLVLGFCSLLLSTQQSSFTLTQISIWASAPSLVSGILICSCTDAYFKHLKHHSVQKWQQAEVKIIRFLAYTLPQVSIQSSPPRSIIKTHTICQIPREQKVEGTETSNARCRIPLTYNFTFCCHAQHEFVPNLKTTAWKTEFTLFFLLLGLIILESLASWDFCLHNNSRNRALWNSKTTAQLVSDLWYFIELAKISHARVALRTKITLSNSLAQWKSMGALPPT